MLKVGIAMRAGSILKVELEDRSASGVLKVLRIAKTIKVKGVRKEVPLVDCELISGNIPVGRYCSKGNKDKVYMLRVQRDLKALGRCEYVFRIQGLKMGVRGKK